jgi:hypothetical protein
MNRRCHLVTTCRHTWNATAAKHVEGMEADSKEGMTVMIANNGEGKILPGLFCVKGGTFRALDKFVQHSPADWGAPPANLKGPRLQKWRKDVAAKLGCAENISAQLPQMCNCARVLSVSAMHLL